MKEEDIKQFACKICRFLWDDMVDCKEGEEAREICGGYELAEFITKEGYEKREECVYYMDNDDYITPYVCSNCGFHVVLVDAIEPKYCQECGAKIVGFTDISCSKGVN